jgi:hypothetical protein
MSRDDYDDDYDRPRRRRRRDDDYDDYRDDVRRGGGPSSGSVTSVGVISIILGSLTLLCGICFMIGSLAFAGAAGGHPAFAQNVFPFQAAAGIMVVLSILVLVIGTLDLIGGIGVLQRRNWGRIMTLVMAGFSGLIGLFFLVVVVIGLAAPGPAENKVVVVLVYLLGAAILFVHCIMSFVVLLSSQNAREFE